jgi:hypothetical protein
MHTPSGALAVIMLCLGCAPADAPVAPGPMPVAVSPAQNVAGEPTRYVALSSLDAADESSSAGLALDLQVANLRAVAASSEVELYFTTEHETRSISLAGPAVAALDTAAIHLPADTFELKMPLTFSGQVRASVKLVYDDATVAHSNALVRHFHSTGNVWHLYDEATRDRLYSGGALTEELQALRRENLVGASAAHAFVGVARGTQLSDDPTFVPANEEGAEHE